MKILMIGQLPPPHHGQSIQIQKIRAVLEKFNYNYQFIRLDFSDEISNVGSFKFKKLYKLCAIFFKICGSLIFFRPDYIYYPPAGPNKIPMYRDFLLLTPIRLFRKKLIFRFHAGGISQLYPNLGKLNKNLFRYIYFSNEVSLCMSESGKVDPMFLQSKKITLIPNGVVDRYIEREKKEECFQVLFVGSCRKSKGIYDFIKVVAQAQFHNKGIKGRVVGDIFSAEEKIAIKEAVDKNIIVYEGIKTGKEKEQIFNEAHLFLFPTFFESENFPTVILEAFSFGLPVIATKWRGVPDQIHDNHNGFLHEVNDVDGMVESLIRIASDNQLYQRISKNARQVFAEKYTMSHFENNFNAFFQSLKLSRLERGLLNEDPNVQVSDTSKA